VQEEKKEFSSEKNYANSRVEGNFGPLMKRNTVFLNKIFHF
jgi:hypothetical protein